MGSVPDSKLTAKLQLPESTRRRFEKARIDISKGYPEIPTEPEFLQEAEEWGERDVEYSDAGLRADPEKKALFDAAKAVNHLAVHIGTEIVGLQLKDLDDKQKDELAALIAERGVVFFRDQDMTPQEQKSFSEYWGPLFPQGPYVPGLPEVVTIWTDFFAQTMRTPTYRQPFQGFHTDMVHEKHPPGYTHLHMDAVPEFGGDLVWTSGYAAYSKLSPAFRNFIDGKKVVFVSKEKFYDRNDKSTGKHHSVHRAHPIVRVHPVTGWKSLYIAHPWMSHIVGLDRKESDMILAYLRDVYENNLDTQVRFKFTPGSSALWDNRITLHSASWDYENLSDRHGTRVTCIAEEPYFDENAITRRKHFGLDDN